MAGAPKDDKMQYLLGELPEEQANALEKEYFADDALFESLGAAETDLLDEYVRGELSASEREAFERRLSASPSLGARVAHARALSAGLEGGDRFARSTRRWALPLVAAAAVLLGALGVWLEVETTRLRKDVEVLQRQKNALERENESLKATKSPAPQPGEQSPTSVAGEAVSLALLPGVLRDSGGGNNFVVPKSAGAVLLEVPLGDQPCERYSVRVEDASGKPILEHRDLPAVTGGGGRDRVAIVATGPSGLPAGDYAVRLGCRRNNAAKTYEEAANFAFHISYR